MATPCDIARGRHVFGPYRGQLSAFLLPLPYEQERDGNHGAGGEVRTELPADFYKDETPESFAEHFGERFREQIRTNKELAAFLEEANRRIKK